MDGSLVSVLNGGSRIGRDGGLPGVASQVTVGARVSICFDGSYSTLSGPPQIGLGGERGGRRGGGGVVVEEEDYRAAVSVALVI